MIDLLRHLPILYCDHYSDLRNYGLQRILASYTGSDFDMIGLLLTDRNETLSPIIAKKILIVFM